jgi:plastocyanin
MQFFGLQVASVLSLLSTLAACASEPHVVSVGKDGLKMTPSTLNAAVGEKVTFKFFPKTHSVARGSFNDPCKPLSETSFFSGGFNTTDANGNVTTFTITIEDALPIYYYCVSPTHCGKGMVGIINPK